MKFRSNWQIYQHLLHDCFFFPLVLKTAKVVTVFRLDYSNYFLFSLLSNTEKILEKLMHKRLCTSNNNNNINSNKINSNIIDNLQFGFRQQYSTSYALINITKNIRKTLDDRNLSCTVFVDLQKTCDSIDHQIMLLELKHFGIDGVSNDLFKSYLPNCNQCVSTNGCDSGFAAKNCCVPHWSLLGSLLFLLHINEI